MFARPAHRHGDAAVGDLRGPDLPAADLQPDRQPGRARARAQAAGRRPRHAPALVAFLERQQVTVTDAPADYEAQIRARRPRRRADHRRRSSSADVAQGQAGIVRLVFDRSRDRARASIDADRVAAARATTGCGAQQRLLLRGVASTVANPLTVENVDLATPQQSGALVLFLVAYYGLFASVMGGMAVALDTTAGERERQSLEPLLMTPARPARDRHRQMARRQRVRCARRAADACRLLPDADVRAAAAGGRALPVRRARVRPLRARARCR